MTDNIDSLLVHYLSAAEISTLRSAVVEVGPGRQLDIPALLEAWRLHVEKMDADLSLPDSDRTVWGAHDLLAALSLRNFVWRAVAALDEGLAAKVSPLLLVIDEKFMSFTEEDASMIIGMVDDLPIDSDQWWWRRIPVRGPIRRELDQIAQSISERKEGAL
jgi:hypothetical protein